MVERLKLRSGYREKHSEIKIVKKTTTSKNLLTNTTFLHPCSTTRKNNHRLIIKRLIFVVLPPLLLLESHRNNNQLRLLLILTTVAIIRDTTTRAFIIQLYASVVFSRPLHIWPAPVTMVTHHTTDDEYGRKIELDSLHTLLLREERAVKND